MKKIFFVGLVAILLLGGVFIARRRAILNREPKAHVVQKPASRSRPAPAPSEPSPTPVPSPSSFPGPGSGFNLGLLGGQSTFCTGVPFPVNGKDAGAKVAAYLGMYKDGDSPKFGPEGEAEVLTNSAGEITVKFHPKNNYVSPIHPDFSGDYFLYVGLIPPWNQPGGKTFAGCGYGGAAKLPTSQHLHFRGDFKWISGESTAPEGSGAGNTLLGGWLAYLFPDGGQDIVAINDFGTPIGMGNPPSLAGANYECSDWWHNLSWGDWWKDDGGLNDVWHSFDIDITAAHKKAVEVSGQKCRKDNPLNQAQVSVPGLFVGPEYGVGGGLSVFMLRNLRAEIY